MINKFNKRIHIQYSKFFKYFFFLRYLFTIFFIAMFLFLLIPKFFNYEKNIDTVKKHLLSHYNLELKDQRSIKYNVFPLPNLSIENTNLRIKNKPIFLNTKDLRIFLTLKSIYSFENLKIKKIILNRSDLDLEINRAKELFEYFKTTKSKFKIQGLDLIFKKKDKHIIKINKINFSNYGFRKNKIYGKIFKKKFEASLDHHYKNLNFTILNTGIKAKFNFDKTEKINYTSGTSKINILDNYLKLNFLINDSKLKIIKSNLRNKYITLSFDSLIKLNPYFEIDSDITINKIDKKFIYSLKLENILQNKEIFKRLNSNNRVTFKKKLSWNDLVKSHFSEFNLAYGRLDYSTEIFFIGGKANCYGDTLLTEEYPRLNFDCTFVITNKKEFLKKFSIVKKLNQNSINFNIAGSLNFLNKKISFRKININNNHIAQEEELFFKGAFEKVLFKQGFLNIFKKEKIKDFILEII